MSLKNFLPYSACSTCRKPAVAHVLFQYLKITSNTKLSAYNLNNRIIMNAECYHIPIEGLYSVYIPARAQTKPDNNQTSVLGFSFRPIKITQPKKIRVHNTPSFKGRLATKS